MTVYILTPSRLVRRHLKHELKASIKHWTASEVTSRCTHTDPVLTFVPSTRSSTGTAQGIWDNISGSLYGDCHELLAAPCPNSSVGTWKKGVFTLVPKCNEYRTRGLCQGTRCKRCLYFPYSLPSTVPWNTGQCKDEKRISKQQIYTRYLRADVRKYRLVV